jgi:hypothetical protein
MKIILSRKKLPKILFGKKTMEVLFQQKEGHFE